MIPQMPRPLYIAYRVGEMTVSLVSRFINATFFGGSTHMTTSARAHIETSPAWKRRERFINALFRFQEHWTGMPHCEWAWLREVEEARKTLERAGASKTRD